MTDRELQAACKEYRELARMQEDIKAELDAIADAIKQAMGGADTLTAGEYKISYKLVTSSRLDTSSLKREVPELAARYTKQTQYRCFVIA